MTRLTPGLASMVVLAAVVAAQDPVAGFSSHVQLVEVYASFTAANSNPVTGLWQSDFDIYWGRSAGAGDGSCRRRIFSVRRTGRSVAVGA